MRALWILIACVPLAARADVPPEATALFDQGMKDMRAGNLEVACKELSASLAKYTDSGTKGALATCYTKLGKVASAWSLWKDLADTASPADRADAARRAKALEPKLPRFVVKAVATPGLVVAINGNAVADPTLAVPLPIDPGPLAVTAHAPGHQDWSQTFQATEGHTTTIEVPALAERTGPIVTTPPTPPVVVGPVPAVVEHDQPSDGRGRRHLIAVAVSVVGVAVVVGGALFGLSASSNFDHAKTDCGGDVDHCATAGLAAATTDVSNARSDATWSTVGFTVGAALVATGAILWVTAPGVHLTPSVEPHSAGLALSGRW